jgi:hypothetical protein
MTTIHYATKNALRNLPAPSAPLKGRGHQRIDFEFSLSNPLAKSLWESIPFSHKEQIPHRQLKGFFRWTRVISPEAAKKAAKVIATLRADFQDKVAAKLAKEAASLPKPAAPPANSQRTETPIMVNREALSTSKLNPEEQAELASLMDGRTHPLGDRAIELKHKSGLTWRQLKRP